MTFTENDNRQIQAEISQNRKRAAKKSPKNCYRQNKPEATNFGVEVFLKTQVKGNLAT